MSFRLVLNSVTLNIELRNRLRNFTEFGSFLGGLRKVVEDTRILSAAEM